MESIEASFIRLLQEQFLMLQEKRPGYTLRRFAMKVNIAAPALSEILNGKRSITPKTVMKVLDRLSIPQAEADYFLKGFLLKNKKSTLDPVSRQKQHFFQSLSTQEFSVIADWWYFAVLSLSETENFESDLNWIAQRLGISLTQATQAVDALVKLGLLIKRKSKGVIKWVPTHKQFNVSSPVSISAIRKNHEQGLELASKVLDQPEFDLREFGAITLAINSKSLPKAKERMRAFRKEMAELTEVGKRSEVYRFQMQFYPLSKPIRTKIGESNES